MLACSVVALTAVESLLLATGHPLGYAIPVVLLLAVLVLNAPDPSLALACIGLVTISWDRVSVRIGGLTLKPAYVAFALALVLELLMHIRRMEHPVVRSARLVLMRRAVVVLLAAMALATVHSGHLLEGLRQLVAIGLGALVPAVVCFRIGRSPERRQALLTWALVGAGIAAVIGIYQFAAAYLGLPSIFIYVGTVGELGRTAGFSYEPAFFAMYLLSLMPFVTVLLLERRDADRKGLRRPRALFVLLLLGVLVSNTRAGYLVLPLAILIPLVSRSSLRPVRARPMAVLAGAVMAVVLFSLVVNFDVSRYLGTRLASITDTEEAASNAPRLRLYSVERRIAEDNLVLGIGPGTLGYVLPEYGLPVADYFLGGPSADLARVVANNIWLQAVLDCGVIGLAGVAAVLGVLFRLSRRSSDGQARWLALGALLPLVIGGALTSIFWDAKYWVLIGIALAADASSQRRAGALSHA